MTLKVTVNDLHFQYLLKSIPGCMFGIDLVNVAQIYYKLSRRQAEFPRILSQKGQNDLKGQSQWPPFSVAPESILGCMFGANLVILAQICDELFCRQGKRASFSMSKPTTWCKSGRVPTDGQTQSTTIPLRPERPRGKNWFFSNLPNRK